MGVLNESTIMGASGVVASYTIGNSCRFNIGDSPRLSRTPSGAGNQKTWTVSFWMKKASTNSGSMFIFSANATTELFWSSSTKKFGAQFTGGNFYLDGLQRDFSAWYHVVWVMDTTQSTDTNRMKVYINGTLQSISPSAWPSLNSDQHVNNTVAHAIGGRSSSSDYYDGYISEFHLIDGTALTASSFGETGDYGEWKPIEYTGSHGTNGYHLDFSNSSALGDDAAGSNDFTVTNITASDQMTDSPTNNFAVMNTLDNTMTSTFTEGNLAIETGASPSTGRTNATFGVTTGKWYWEYLLTTGSANGLIGIGECGDTGAIGSSANDYVYQFDGTKLNNGSGSSYGSSSTTNDVVGVALDLDSGTTTLTIYKNGSSLGTMYSSLNSGITYLPNVGDIHSSSNLVGIFNFGQDGTFAGNVTAGGNADGNGYGNFKYAVPSGFLALCSQNLPDPTVIPSEHFGTVTYTGDGGSDRTISTDLSAVDFVWLKKRSGADDFRLANTVTGGNKHLKSNATDVEATGTTVIRSFSGSTFNVGSDGSVNGNSATYVAWCWKAGTTTSGTTSGTGTGKAYSASYNASAGFSIVSYLGNGTAGHTIPHHLGVAPELMIMKGRAGTDDWYVYSASTSMGNTKGMQLSNTGAANTTSAYWNDTSPTSSVWTVSNNSGNNSNDAAYIAYCFTSVEGFSKVGGEYAGNGSSSDGTFVYTGFRPSWICLKRIDGVSHWRAHTSGNRTPPDVNGVFARLEPSGNGAEATSTSSGDLDFLSNGFKIKDGTAHVGASGNEYLYIAFAKTPFSHSNAV
jgi:hypothetical protein